MNKKLIMTLVCIALVFLVIGCVAPQAEKQVVEKMNLLQQKYLIKENFSTNQAIMNNYINDLSLLKGQNLGGEGKIIEAELYSAQTFYYLNKALISSTSIDYKKFSCSSKEAKETISSINLAEEYQKKAVSSIQALSPDQKENLRANQLDTVKNYEQTISQIKSFFEQKC
ncbi:MAG: hypothetical protein WC462_01865 [archaeon]